MVVQPPTFAIIGAGLTGLSSAYFLRKSVGPGARIVVVDTSDRIGGKLRTVSSQRGPIEVGAEAYLAFRRDATAFFTELGLGDELVNPSTLPSKLYVGGKLHSMPRTTVMGIPASSTGLENLLSEETCARIDSEADPAVSAPMHWVAGDDVNLGQLVSERYGTDVVDHLVSPFIGGVYSSTAFDLGLRATVPQLANALDELVYAGEPVSLSAAVQRVLDARAAAKQPRLGSEDHADTEEVKPKLPVVFHTFRNGFAKLYDAMAAQSGAEILLQTAVSAIAPREQGTGFALTLSSVDGASASEEGQESSKLDVDGLIVATPAPVTANLLRSVNADAAELVSGIEMASSSVVAMRFDTAEGLPEFNGILCETDSGLTAKAFTVSSRKWPHIGDRGGALVRASFGRLHHDEMLTWSDEKLIETAAADFAAVTGFKEPVAEAVVQRWWNSLPSYGVGHNQLMDFVDAELAAVPRLAVTGAWHRGPGIPVCLSQARAAVKKVVADLG